MCLLLQASVCWIWQSSSPSQRPLHPCWPGCWKLLRGKVSSAEETIKLLTTTCYHTRASCYYWLLLFNHIWCHHLDLLLKTSWSQRSYFATECNDWCCFLQVWITPLYIEHLPLVLDLKSDSILTVVSSFLITLFFSPYMKPKSFHSRMRETNTEKRKCHRLKQHRQTVVMQRAKCVCISSIFNKEQKVPWFVKSSVETTAVCLQVCTSYLNLWLNMSCMSI